MSATHPFYADARRSALGSDEGTGFLIGGQLFFCLLVAAAAFFVSGGSEASSTFDAGDLFSPLTLTGHTVGALLAAAVVSVAFWFVIILSKATELFNDCQRGTRVPIRAPFVTLVVTTVFVLVLACVPGPHLLMWLAVVASVASVLWAWRRAKTAERNAAV